MRRGGFRASVDRYVERTLTGSMSSGMLVKGVRGNIVLVAKLCPEEHLSLRATFYIGREVPEREDLREQLEESINFLEGVKLDVDVYDDRVMVYARPRSMQELVGLIRVLVERVSSFI